MARRKFSSLEEEFLSKTGVTLPDGRVLRPGGSILSAGDAANAAATNARNVALYQQTAGASEAARLAAREQARVNYFMPAAGAAVAAPALAAAAPTAAPQPGLASFSPEEDFKATQLLRDAQTRKLLPDRNYSEQALAKATPLQRIAESNLLQKRIGDRALSIASVGETPAAAVPAPNSMAAQAAEFLPGTQIKAPAGSAIASDGAGNLFLRGPDGVINRIKQSDTGALSSWAASQTAGATSAPIASFSDELTSLAADKAKAISLAGNNPGMLAQIEAAYKTREDQLDPTGEKRDAIKFTREQKEAEARFAAERTQRGLLAGDAEARAEASFEKMLPDIQRAYEATAGDYASLEKTVGDQVQRTLSEAGAPIVKSALAAANVLRASNRTPSERAAAKQLLSAAESNNPEAVAAVVGALAASYPLELGGVAGSAEAFAKEAASLRGLAARQLQQEGSQLRSQLARLQEAARYKLPTGRPADGATMASVADGGAAAPNAGAVAGNSALDLVGGGAPAPAAAGSVPPATMAAYDLSIPEQRYINAAQGPSAFGVDRSGEANQARVIDSIKGIARFFNPSVDTGGGFNVTEQKGYQVGFADPRFGQTYPAVRPADGRDVGYLDASKTPAYAENLVARAAALRSAGAEQQARELELEAAEIQGRWLRFGAQGAAAQAVPLPAMSGFAA